MSSHDCAQRLSASKIGSHRGSAHGIGCGNVLNACRRQRSVHTSARQRCAPTAGAQRLSASKIGSRCTSWPHPTALWRAQRLSASKIGSLEIHVCLLGTVIVLNACRRQRSVHADYSKHLEAIHEVLNACRRQRSVHLTSRRHVPIVCMCSTPVGVKDRFTRCRRWSVCFCCVLNACRRQRSVHSFSGPLFFSDDFVLNACRRQRSVHRYELHLEAMGY